LVESSRDWEKAMYAIVLILPYRNAKDKGFLKPFNRRLD